MAYVGQTRNCCFKICKYKCSETNVLFRISKNIINYFDLKKSFPNYDKSFVTISCDIASIYSDIKW